MISVLILTKNEEHDLPACLASLSWSDDINVFDSFSSDKTVDLAAQVGACVSQRHFDGYASQRNAALQQLNFKHEWILILDADERVSLELVEEMLSVIKTSLPEQSGFRMRRKDFLFGKWLKHAQISPFYIRLVKKGNARYHREINEVLEVSGKIVVKGTLTGPLKIIVKGTDQTDTITCSGAVYTQTDPKADAEIILQGDVRWVHISPNVDGPAELTGNGGKIILRSGTAGPLIELGSGSFSATPKPPKNTPGKKP